MKTQIKCQVAGCNNISALAGNYKTKDGLKPYWRKTCQKHHLAGTKVNPSNRSKVNPTNLSFAEQIKIFNIQAQKSTMAKLQAAKARKLESRGNGEILD